MGFGVSAEIEFNARFPVLTNAAEPTEMARRVPGCYLFIGNGAASQGGCGVNNP